MPLPGGCTPGPPRTIAPGCAGKGRAESLSMKNSGWSCRRVLWVPAPIAFGGGVGGQPAPRVVSTLVSGTLMFSARGCGKRSDEWSGHRPGVAPPDPRMRLPWMCGGRAGVAPLDEKFWMARAGRFYGFLPPITLGGGGRGTAGPPGKGLLDFPYPHTTPASRRGLHPVGVDCPGHAGTDGRNI
ncbi:hypothetical protein Metli_1508 [Methanofollis liminatans DSM 4140]|uniref:Uncharacterized protein n=1 Tax=Methanofollis liminatans DSM 4140 TaxID=28892 RepID=J0S9X8_9EURY|nr:hypothetical protein Metli_1508 [Methanofollis liminatans DSM 4140]